MFHSILLSLTIIINKYKNMKNQETSNKIEKDVKLFLKRDTELKIKDLKIQGLEAEIKVLKHLVNMYALEEIYKNI